MKKLEDITLGELFKQVCEAAGKLEENEKIEASKLAGSVGYFLEVPMVDGLEWRFPCVRLLLNERYESEEIIRLYCNLNGKKITGVNVELMTSYPTEYTLEELRRTIIRGMALAEKEELEKEIEQLNEIIENP